ncbi:MAG: hypothetical protein GXY18_03035 [Methanomicrobiales archaeon]|nr:hypothetical protein [Methanomicrobiales archaeon]
MGPIKLTSDLDTSYIFRPRKTTSLLKKSRTIQGGSHNDSHTPQPIISSRTLALPFSSIPVAASWLHRTPPTTPTSKPLKTL